MATSSLPKTETSQASGGADYFVRFSVSQRVEHVVLLVTFTALSVTGLAEKYFTAGWAQTVILALGGIEYTRLIHRAFGVLLGLSAAYHFSYLLHAMFWRHSRPSILLNLKDVRDVVQLLRYGFGFADKPPQFGRFDYRQKFEYWGVFLGGIIMLVSGAILTYPLAVTTVLPGQLVAASREAHSNEATLAVIVIVIWHLYDTIFKPGVFPADIAIFTGRISRKRMLEEHPAEYAELVGSENVTEDAAAPPPEPPRDQPRA